MLTVLSNGLVIVAFISIYCVTYVISSYNSTIFNNRPPLPEYKDTAEYLIDNPGCYVPKYEKKDDNNIKYTVNFAATCGQRIVFVDRITDTLVMFRINLTKLKKFGHNAQCCYQYTTWLKALDESNSNIIHSACIDFRNGTVKKHLTESLSVACYVTKEREHKTVVYTDRYLLLQKRYDSESFARTPKVPDGHWNVLMVAVDSLSRSRIDKYLPKTVEYLKINKWIDYRGYQTLGMNFFQNMVAMLTGKDLQLRDDEEDNLICLMRNARCNDYMIWNYYKKEGYYTAYAEDWGRYMFRTENGFTKQTTDHYPRPMFLVQTNVRTNLHCLGKQTSGEQLTNYVIDFVTAYKYRKFFGLFKFNTIGHNNIHYPQNIMDQNFTNFLMNLNSSGVLSNTFVFFFSDHGIQYADTNRFMPTYHEDKLPTMFVHVPYRFRQTYDDKYHTMMLNANRLTTPYDVYVTLSNILDLSHSAIRAHLSEGCPQCTSLFNEKSVYRTCAEANIGGKWCSCRETLSTSIGDAQTNECIKVSVSYIQNKTKHIKTKPCTFCQPLKLKKVLRTHIDIRRSRRYYFFVVAFEMTPGDMAYEASVETNGREYYNLLPPTLTLTPYKGSDDCVINPKDREFCICGKVEHCYD